MCGLRYVNWRTILTWPICVLQIADLNEAGSALAEELGASKARFIKTSVTERGAMRCGEARVACASVFHLSCVPNAGPQARCRLRLTLPFPRLAGSMASFIALAWVRRCGVSRFSGRVVLTAGDAGGAMKTVTRGEPHDEGLFDFVVKVNLFGTFNVSTIAAAAMAKQAARADGSRGVIVNVASVAAFEGQKGQLACMCAPVRLHQLVCLPQLMLPCGCHGRAEQTRLPRVPCGQ